jgi:hypothetical protein
MPEGQKPGSPQQISLAELRAILTERFSDSELQTLCFDLDVGYDELPGSNKADKARELVAYLERRGRIADIGAVGRRLRPDVSWDDLMALDAASAGQPAAHVSGRKRTYSFLIVTGQEHFANDAKADAERFFAERQIPVATVKPVISTRGLETGQWGELLGRALRQLTELKVRNEEIHFLSAAFWLWNLALGAEIADRHPMILYHYQRGTLYPIWQVSREIKERKATPDAPYSLCAKPRLHQPGTRDDGAVIVFSVGAPHIVPNAIQHMRASLPDLPVWEIGTPGFLDPANCEQWIVAAAELARSLEEISGGGRRELWLCGTAPAALGLMVGTAVGRYRRIHLLHFLETEGTYRELLTLPWS